MQTSVAKLQRTGTNTTLVNGVPPIVQEALRSPGQPLASPTRAFMEPRFGHDFSQVRVHTDARAAESAQAIRALAYTTGHHIVFRHGQYSPDTTAGKRLLAHELAHVVQQSSGRVVGAGAIRDPGDTFEQAAEHVANQVMEQTKSTAQTQQSACAAAPSPASIQRQAESDTRSDEEEGKIVETDDQELFQEAEGGEEKELEETGPSIQTMRHRALGTAIQRQVGPSIPPPPTVFPPFFEWFFDVSDVMSDLWASTCTDRLERGFFVMWNEKSKKSFAGETVLGNDHEIELGPMPADRKPIFPVGWFHTHPRPKPGFVQVAVGPSTKDKKTSKDIDLPGAVRDFSTPGVNDCKKAGTFFFGPMRRPPLF